MRKLATLTGIASGTEAKTTDGSCRRPAGDVGTQATQSPLSENAPGKTGGYYKDIVANVSEDRWRERISVA